MDERSVPSTPPVPEMIHRLGVLRHMMRAEPLGRTPRIECNGRLPAESADAPQVIEIGRDVHDLPRADVVAPFFGTGRSTHCPLKGDAARYDVAADGGDQGGGVVLRRSTALRRGAA